MLAFMRSDCAKVLSHKGNAVWVWTFRLYLNNIVSEEEQFLLNCCGMKFHNCFCGILHIWGEVQLCKKSTCMKWKNAGRILVPLELNMIMVSAIKIEIKRIATYKTFSVIFSSVVYSTKSIYRNCGFGLNLCLAAVHGDQKQFKMPYFKHYHAI